MSRRTTGVSKPVPHAPAPPRGLIGRQSELRVISKLLLDRNARLLTLTGAPGTGKTRLALALAETGVDKFVDGIWFVPLAAVRRPDLLLPTIAQTLGIARIGGQSLSKTLSRALRSSCALAGPRQFRADSPRRIGCRGTTRQLPQSQRPGHEPSPAPCSRRAPLCRTPTGRTGPREVLERALAISMSRNANENAIWTLLALGDLALRQGDAATSTFMPVSSNTLQIGCQNTPVDSIAT